MELVPTVKAMQAELQKKKDDLQKKEDDLQKKEDDLQKKEDELRWFSFTCYYFNQLWQSIKPLDPESYGIMKPITRNNTLC